MPALSLGWYHKSSASETAAGSCSGDNPPPSEFPRDYSRPPSRTGRRGRSASHSIAVPFSPSRSLSVDSSAASVRSRSRNSSTTSFFSRFRRSSVSTTGSDGLSGPSTPTDSRDDMVLTINFKHKTFNRRRARTLETIPQNAATNNLRSPTMMSRSGSQNSMRPPILTASSDTSIDESIENLNAKSRPGFAFQRRNVQDLSRSRVTFEEPEHPLHESMSSSSSLRSRPTSPAPDYLSTLRIPDAGSGSSSTRRPRSLMSSLSENDIHRKEDDGLSKYFVSAPISPSSLEPTPNEQSYSPSPSSSSSSLSNYKSLAKLRKRVASAFFSNSSQKETQKRLSSSRSSSEVNVAEQRPSVATPLATSPVPVVASGASSSLTRSLSNLSHSSNSTSSSSALRTRPRSQTLSSLDNERRNRREFHQLHQITGITNLFSLRLRTGSEQNFAELKVRENSAVPQKAQAPRQSDPLLPLALLDTQLPDGQDGENPADYLKRVESVVSRNYIALLLAKSDDEFHLAVLRMFCTEFNFVDEPIDMALRKFLMVVQLPREVQQIDRVLDAFAQRYHYCNPELYISKDQAYVVTFSLMILHTDAFNKSNKHKMQKLEYVRNTQVDGVASEVLECFFDNITCTPFVHMDEEIDPTSIHSEKSTDRLLSLGKQRKSLVIGKPTKDPVDPYVLIADNRLQDMRPRLSDVLNLEDPYSYVGTAPQFEVKVLHKEFINGPLLQILPPRSRQQLLVSPELGFHSYVMRTDHTMKYVKVAKIGVLTSLERKKKKSSKTHWRSWGALLTLSRVYFFKDVNWVRGLMDQLDATMSVDEKAASGDKGPYMFPPIQGFHADEVMSTENMIALLDRSYTSRKHAFAMIAKGGVQDWFVADSEAEMNDWITKVNYAAALNTSGANLQGVEKTAEGNPELQHLVGSLAPIQTRSQYSTMRSAASEKTNVLFSSLFYDNGSLHSPLSDANSVTSVEETAIEFASQVSEGRRDALECKVRELEDHLFLQTQELDADSRTAKHLSILTPIMPRTRDSLILSAGMVAAKMDWLRIEVMRTRCFREILVKELDSEREMIALLQKKLAVQKSQRRDEEKMGGKEDVGGGGGGDTVIACFVDPAS